MKLLIIEDEQALRDAIQQYMETQGYLCEIAGNFEEAMDKIDYYEYDCIVVDIGLPMGSGLDIVKELKSIKSKAGIIIISARDAVDDKVMGLQLGSDDYLTKPFHLSELNARVAAIIRRRNFGGEEKILFNEIEIHPAAKSVKMNDKYLDLTQKEYDLLVYFISNRGRLITKSALAQHIWGDQYDQAESYDFLYTHIKNLRKKMMESGTADYIKNIYGTGYKFTDN
ncbi:MAG: transcriptional regulator [Ferruginibacter sp.]|uniref:response regulator transcription factor n=1 Tax=Ferruginibacter sp. TaxID=1940288 RepID=UPI00265A58CE|nr:response regulator transcription factor [Ferruginibacter sp.]MDB5275502.1 transcriptional regulator [Ferruginibacter sp.]